MSPTAHDEDDLPPAAEQDPPGATVWIVAGCVLVLSFIAALALLHPSP